MKKTGTSQTGDLRPPIVTVLGHVDHGKTTLLDSIRKTSVAEREAGGITQSIGASVITTHEGKKITFIDTPGHVAFSKMRSQGAKVADIAILVVAANDGVKPQTEEALKYIKEAKIPFIVAITKIDLATGNIEKVKKQLEKAGVSLEKRGGEVLPVSVSGKTGKGVPELLEMISLVAELSEIKADKEGQLEAVIIETGKDKRGPLVSSVVRNGTLSVGEEIMAGNVGAKIRGLFNDKGKSVKKVFPGEPAQLLGFSQLPPVGSRIRSIKPGEELKPQTDEKRTVEEISEGQIPVVVKAKSAGALEAVLANVPENIVVVYSGVGDVNESDVFLAKSASEASIFVFGAKVSRGVLKLAGTEGIKIERFDVIYELFDRWVELGQAKEVKILGKAEVIATFPYDDKLVAGCKVIEGRIAKSDNFVLMRGDSELGEARVASMRKEKQDIDKAEKGEEFGVIFKPQLDFRVGDVILSVIK